MKCFLNFFQISENSTMIPYGFNAKNGLIALNTKMGEQRDILYITFRLD